MKFSPYSFSKQNVFEQCPKKFEYKYIDKIKTEFKMNAVLEKGSYIHLLLEELAKNNGVLPEVKYSFKHSTDEEIKEYNIIAKDFIFSEIGQKYLDNKDNSFYGAEVEFGIKIIDGEWVTCGYYDKGAFFRGKIDHMNKTETKVEVLDWKTGSISKFPAPLQLVMYAIWAFIAFPEIEKVDSAFVYIEHEKEKRYPFKRSMLTKLKAKFAEKVFNMENASSFSKKESPLCDYCEFRLQGICEEVSSLSFSEDMMKFNPTTQTKWFYMHPESGRAWSQDHKLRPSETDGSVEEIDESMFWRLDELGYDIER